MFCALLWPQSISAQNFTDFGSDFGVIDCGEETAAGCSPLTLNQAGGPQLFTGYAWSPNIGWISFGNSDFNANQYGVWLSPSNQWSSVTENFTGLSPNRTLGGRHHNTFGVPGYAWSSNIGWIKFDPDIGKSSHPELNDFPSASDNYAATLKVEDSKVTGWARACAVFENDAICEGPLKADKYRGGWDGWIKLSGETADNSTYGGDMSYLVGAADPQGFDNGAKSWGGPVVGWIDWCNLTGGTGETNADYCADFEGVQATCSLGVNISGGNPGSPGIGDESAPLSPDGGQTVVVNLGDGESADIDWTIQAHYGAAPYKFDWYWNRSSGNEHSGSKTPESSFTATTHYSCGEGTPATVQDSGYATVLDHAAATASCSNMAVVHCSADPNNHSDSDPILTEPNVESVEILSQSIGLPAVSTTAAFHNDGGETTLSILEAVSMVDSRVSLSDFGTVSCLLDNEPLDNNSVFKPCDFNNTLQSSSGSQGNIFFNVKVDDQPSDLKKYSPYRITIGPSDATGPNISFPFEYKAATIKQS
jgi:hypothetical protein